MAEPALRRDPLPPFERSQRRWLARDPRIQIDVPVSGLDPLFQALLDGDVPPPDGVAFSPWIPEATSTQQAILAGAAIAWFVALVGFFLSLSQDSSMVLRAALFTGSVAFGFVTRWAYGPVAAEHAANDYVEAGVWRDGRWLTSAAAMFARDGDATLIPRHRILDAREREAVTDEGRTRRRVELLVDDHGIERSVELPERAAGDVEVLRGWLDDDAWLRSYAHAWTWAVESVDSLDELARRLAERRWPLDAGFRFGRHHLVHEPSEPGERGRWALLGQDGDAVIRLGDIRLQGGADEIARTISAAIGERRVLPTVRSTSEDLASRLETPEEHGVSPLSVLQGGGTATS